MPLRMYLKQYVFKIVCLCFCTFAYASRLMTETESKHAQIQKELLAAVFACTNYHDFMHCNKAVIETDHKPIVTIVKKPPHA